MPKQQRDRYERFNPAVYLTDAESVRVFVDETRKMERERCTEAIERKIGQHLIDNAEVDGELTMAVRSGMRLAILAIHGVK